MSHRTRIKICGVTRPEDARHAADCGADAVGVVFVPASARSIEPEAATAVRAVLPPFVQLVALFMDADTETVQRVCMQLQPALLQFHGGEEAAFCRSFGRPYLKSVPAAGGADLAAAERSYPDAAGLLVDGHAAGEMGGSGRDVRPEQLSGATRLPLVLAGGLDADNVQAAVATFRPWAVDVSSGVEATPGIKAADRVAAFIKEVRQADEQRPSQL